MRHLIASLVFLTACGGSAKQPTGNVASGAGNVSIRSVDWANRTYDSDEGGSHTVKDGEAEIDFGPDMPDVRGSFSVSAARYGDTNGDGVEDAIIITAFNGGGTGTFDTAEIFTIRGAEPVRIGSIPGGDRGDGGLDDVRIEGDKLIVERNLSLDDDGACCPSKLVREVWHWDGNAFTEDASARQTLDNPNYQPE